MDAIENKSKTA